MTDLVTFLRDRLDDTAKSADEVHRDDCDSLVCDSSCCETRGRGPCDCGVPARVLADVAAKRAIVDEWARLVFDDREPPWGTGWREGLGFALRHLAAVYSEHPDYRQEWAP